MVALRNRALSDEEHLEVFGAPAIVSFLSLRPTVRSRNAVVAQVAGIEGDILIIGIHESEIGR